MAYDGFGNFSRVHSWAADKLAAIKITAVRHDEEDDGFATAFNEVVLRNGVAAMTGDLKLGGNSIEGVELGAEATPSFSWAGDMTTGFWSPSTAVVACSINSVEVWRTDSTGVVLQGTLAIDGDIGISGFTALAAILEDVTVDTVAMTGTIHIDAKATAIVIHDVDATANWTFDFRGDSTTSLDSIMQIYESATFAIECPQGTTAYYCSAITVDGLAPAQVLWYDGGAPTSGNVSGTDVYAITVIKTAAATFIIRASQAQAK